MYARARPGYPESLIDWVLAEAGLRRGDRVADVGCGTGILTCRLAARRAAVVGIDPDADMLAEARAAGGAVVYCRAEAAATGLADGSVALVTVAQAFHWFDLDAALDEFHRVLVPGGHVAAIWNIRGEGGFMDGYDALLLRFSSEYAVVETWESTLAKLRSHPRVARVREGRVAHAQRFDLEGLRGRAWSSSYVFRGVREPEAFDRALEALFRTHARGGTIEFPYRAVALVFEVTPSSR